MSETDESLVPVDHGTKIIILVVIGVAAVGFLAFIAYILYRFADAARALYEEVQLATGSIQQLTRRTRQGISWMGWGSDDDDHPDDKKEWWAQRRFNSMRTMMSGSEDNDKPEDVVAMEGAK